MRSRTLLALLSVLLVAASACWWDHHHEDDDYRVRIRLDDSCHHAPFRLYLDGRDSEDRIGEIDEVGGELTRRISGGWHILFVRDADGDWVGERGFYLDDDDTIWIDC